MISSVITFTYIYAANTFKQHSLFIGYMASSQVLQGKIKVLRPNFWAYII